MHRVSLSKSAGIPVVQALRRPDEFRFDVSDARCGSGYGFRVSSSCRNASEVYRGMRYLAALPAGLFAQRRDVPGHSGRRRQGMARAHQAASLNCRGNYLQQHALPGHEELFPKCGEEQ